MSPLKPTSRSLIARFRALTQRHGRGHRWLRSALVASAVAGLAQAGWAVLRGGEPVPAAVAADRKAAVQLASQARQSYETKQFSKAVDLYQQAWQADPSETGLLYNAARAAHLGGLLERSSDLYGQFLELAGRDAAVAAKAKGYLAEVRNERVQAEVTAADAALAANQPAEASRRFAAALALAPDRADLQLRTAEADAAAGDAEAARIRLRTWLTAAPAASPDHSRALALQARLDPPAPVTRREGGARAIAGWTALGLGLGAGAGAVFELLRARSDQAALDGQIADRKDGLVRGIGYDDAVSASERIASYRTWAAILGGVGVAAAGVGTWLLLAGPEAPAVVVTPWPAGASVAWKF